jgi:hypothetical protein
MAVEGARQREGVCRSFHRNACEFAQGQVAVGSRQGDLNVVSTSIRLIADADGIAQQPREGNVSVFMLRGKCLGQCLRSWSPHR